MPDGDSKEDSNGDSKEDSLEQAIEQVMEQVWSKYGASNRASNSERNTEGKKSDNTRYRDLSIINSNILIWLMGKLSVGKLRQ